MSEGLVGKVKVESLKKAEEVKRQKTKMQRAGQRAKTPVVRKMPQQWMYRN